LLAQQQADEQQKADDVRARNRIRIIPSSTEIQCMETAIIWPARYLTAIPQLLRVVQAVARGRALDREMPHIARRLRLPGRLVRRWNREGLDTIAYGLRRDNVRIF
jgi:hypothetical protein